MKNFFRHGTILVIVIALYVWAGKPTGATGADPKGPSGLPTKQQAAAHGAGRATVPTQTAEKPITNSIGMKLVLIPPGEFMMGSKETAQEIGKAFKCNTNFWFNDEHPRHLVRITKPFYLGAFHVTVGQFRRFVRDTGHRTEAEKGIARDESGAGGLGCYPDGTVGGGLNITWRNPGFPQTDDHPVVEVCWDDAVAFCSWLSRTEGKKYRLPTEAEWEYACRAGTQTRYYNGDDPEKLVEVGNVADGCLKEKWPWWRPYETGDGPISAKDGYLFTSPVGSFKPNAWGLYDMHGNAWQWCADQYTVNYGDASARNDPKGPSEAGPSPPGDQHVARGGAFCSAAADARSARRSGRWWSAASFELGFRVARLP